MVILDFGVAIELKQQDDPQATERLTEGTVTYMSPEQSTGRPLSPASDWYSVGVMLFRALTGEHPFVGTRLDVMARKQTTDAPDPRNLAADLPDDLAALCVDLLRRAPEERPTGEDVLRRLGAADTGHAAARGGPGHPRRLFLGRKPQSPRLRRPSTRCSGVRRRPSSCTGYQGRGRARSFTTSSKTWRRATVP